MSEPADLTRRDLQNDGTYDETTIKGEIHPHGSNLAGLSFGGWAKYANTLYTPSYISEGDQIEDQEANIYDVHHIDLYHFLNSAEHYQAELVKVQAFTLQTLTLGAADDRTGWPALSYADSTIYGSIAPKGSAMLATGLSYYNRYDYTFLTAATVVEGDRIKDSDNTIYEVKQVTLHKSSRAEFTFYWKVCGLVKSEWNTRPATSGIWHLDSLPLRTDPRNRTKTLLDTYLDDETIQKADGATAATYLFIFDGLDAPLTRMFNTLGYDFVGVISRKPTQTTLHAIHRTPCIFNDPVQIELYAVNKSTLTATNLLEQAEQGIRHVLTLYASDAVRNLRSTEPKPVDLGSTRMENLTISLDYRRFNDDLTPTAPTSSYGDDWIYECDHLSGGVEGTWDITNHLGGSTITIENDVDNNVYMNLTAFVADAYIHNGTALSLSSSIYTTIRWRYKTTSNATAKIIIEFSDASTQVVLLETSSSTFATGSSTIVTGKTINYIQLYACDGTGTVTYSFIQICKGTYTLPNCIGYRENFLTVDANTGIPGWSEVTDPLGTALVEVRTVHDLSLQQQALTWKRPQTTGGKTDYNNDDVIIELHHYQGDTHLWHWLDTGSKQFKARLIEINRNAEDTDIVELVWREYRKPAGSETVMERFNFNL